MTNLLAFGKDVIGGGDSGGGASPEAIGIKYDEANDMVQLYYNGQWCNWQSGGMTYPVGTETVFNYTGQVAEFIIPATGNWKLEVYGSKGGNASSYSGGLGGYATGEITLSKNDKLYITVGSAGLAGSTPTGGYNGGGNGKYYTASGYVLTGGGGGGATHIADHKYSNGLLVDYDQYRNALLIVAGGGGGAYYDTSVHARDHAGGTGGGTTGGNGAGESGTISNTGGTQTTGYAFGLGQTCTGTYGGGGGGGGFYGGIGNQLCSAGGGSGYLNTSKLIAGTYSMTNGVRKGDGFARLTYLGV